MKNLLVNMVNLFVGGSDTTSSTLCWSLFHLSTDPVLQEKAIEEIEQVIGFDRLPSLEDRPNTPFLEAIVCETHRITSLAFAGIPRLVSKDTSLGGYFIEKVVETMDLLFFTIRYVLLILGYESDDRNLGNHARREILGLSG